MVQDIKVIEVEIDGRIFWVHPVGSWVLEFNNVVADALAVSLATRQSYMSEESESGLL
ncbi:MAG: hypothetical protein QF925_10640 [Dehalococcoidia bacterium]|jgi:hypothetical protein|nr:hypothetical protein [Dehalococcoidia bacterium]|tara:strand:- start:893 stop:1066 length:174 start_codon:yes stop_codon:yes gene_type:complete